MCLCVYVGVLVSVCVCVCVYVGVSVRMCYDHTNKFGITHNLNNRSQITVIREKSEAPRASRECLHRAILSSQIQTDPHRSRTTDKPRKLFPNLRRTVAHISHAFHTIVQSLFLTCSVISGPGTSHGLIQKIDTVFTAMTKRQTIEAKYGG